jgi:hypothetical protein
VLSNSYVDEARIIENSIEDLILELRPKIVVKGKEHENQDNPETRALAVYGGKLLFSSGESVLSSLELIRNEITQFDSLNIRFPQEYSVRNGINRESLVELCDCFQGLKVVVIGDLIIDEYITCQPLGMSQEDPTIVVTPVDSLRFIGGAGIVAAHAAGLGGLAPPLRGGRRKLQPCPRQGSLGAPLGLAFARMPFVLYLWAALVYGMSRTRVMTVADPLLPAAHCSSLPPRGRHSPPTTTRPHSRSSPTTSAPAPSW